MADNFDYVKFVSENKIGPYFRKEVSEGNIERDQKVKILGGPHTGRTATVHDFDSEKDSAQGDDWVDVIMDTPKKPMVSVKASELKPL